MSKTVEKLKKFQNLSFDESKSLFTELMEGKCMNLIIELALMKIEKTNLLVVYMF